MSRDQPSRDQTAAILPVSIGSVTSEKDDLIAAGESTIVQPVIFYTPSYDDIPPIPIYTDCITGTCDCVHMIGGFPCQLKPCRAAQFLFGQSSLPSISQAHRDYLWSGFARGFAIVDEDCSSLYNCENYDSITSSEFYDEMSALLTEELSVNKVSFTPDQPLCVHSLGAVKKSNGKLRPITDCSRPEGTSINNFMKDTFESFSYNSVDDAVSLLSISEFMSVVDVASAYRSVNVRADQVKYQGLSWDFGLGPKWLLDRRLCFGLRCAPNIFNAISNFVVQIVQSWGADRVVKLLGFSDYRQR